MPQLLGYRMLSYLLFSWSQSIRHVEGLLVFIDWYLKIVTRRQQSARGTPLVTNSFAISKLWNSFRSLMSYYGWLQKVQSALRRFATRFWPAPAIKVTQGTKVTEAMVLWTSTYRVRAPNNCCFNDWCFKSSFTGSVGAANGKHPNDMRLTCGSIVHDDLIEKKSLLPVDCTLGKHIIAWHPST
jgi:hypothetical protein